MKSINTWTGVHGISMDHSRMKMSAESVLSFEVVQR